MNKLNTKIYLASLDDAGQFCYQRFAELVRQDEREACAQDYLQDCCDAVDAARLEEREACVVECGVQMSLIPAQAWTVNPYEQCMKAIKARGKPDPSFKNYLDDKWSGIV